MVNQAVGDALSGLLLAEAALRRRAWGLAEWDALYADLPSRQLKARARAPRRAPRAGGRTSGGRAERRPPWPAPWSGAGARLVEPSSTTRSACSA
jgi:hypothetical protein